MSFVKRIIKDRIVTPAKRYKLTKVEGEADTYDLQQVGNVTEIGTPTNAELLQRYENTLDEHEMAIGNKADASLVNNINNTVADMQLGNVVVGKAASLNKILPVSEGGTGTTTASLARSNLGVPPTSHAVSGNTHGLSTPTLNGHAKVINSLDKTAYADGEALSAYQGKVLNDKITNSIFEIGDTLVTERVPSGFLLADSSSTSITTYSALYRALKGKYGAQSTLTERILPSPSYYNANYIVLKYIGNRFILIQPSGSTTRRWWQSLDGITWTTISPNQSLLTDTAYIFGDISWNGSKFLCVVTDYVGSSILKSWAYTSADLTTWTSLGACKLNTVENNEIHPGSITYYNGAWTAVFTNYYGYTSTYNGIYRSTDGVNWTRAYSVNVAGLQENSFVSNNTILLFVGNNHTIYSSSNGTTWTATSATTLSQVSTLGLTVVDNVFYLTCSSSSNSIVSIFSSTNGTAWTKKLDFTIPSNVSNSSFAFTIGTTNYLYSTYGFVYDIVNNYIFYFNALRSSSKMICTNNTIVINWLSTTETAYNKIATLPKDLTHFKLPAPYGVNIPTYIKAL